MLGGGYGADDGIFRYKRSFAPHGLVPFFVGRRVLEPELYDELTARVGGAGEGAFFPAYREGHSDASARAPARGAGVPHVGPAAVPAASAPT